MATYDYAETALEQPGAPDRADWIRPDRRTVWLRRLYLVLVGVSALPGIGVVVYLLRPDSVIAYFAAAALVLLFSVLFTWIASNFWMMVFGVGRIAFGRGDLSDGVDRTTPGPDTRMPRSAIVMPIYNEDPARVAAGIQATLESLDQTGALAHFDFYILSDTQDPDVWVREEIAWMELISLPAFRNRVFYRRRPESTERKSGNIKDFLEKWGHSYRYMIVLDADSVMDGGTMVELVRRMEADPRCGLIQTWPQITNGRTLFARLHQFASAVYGRVLAVGMATLINPHGNYWGHNAIVRVDAFMRSCGLPNLPGKAPIGGEILSHDFVEAAFLVRRGWKVKLAPDLGGSYEEGPPNMVQHIARDQRWCQGNVQHIWMLAARGMHPVSRVNFLTGIFAYASSPVWLLFVVVAAVISFSDHSLFSPASVLVQKSSGGWAVETSSIESLLVGGLLVATVLFVLAPKVFALVVALFQKPEPRLKLIGNFLAETVLSIMMAPTVMMRHSYFIGRLVLGRGVNWNPQQRDERKLGWGEAVRAFHAQTLTALAIAGSAVVWPTMVHLWLTPVLFGLLVSIPLAVWTGRAQERPVLFMPTGLGAIPATVCRTNQLGGHYASRMQSGNPVLRILEDPKLASLHLFMLATEPGRNSYRSVEGGVLAKVNRGDAQLDKEEQRSLLSNPEALRRLQAERAVQSSALERHDETTGTVILSSKDGHDIAPEMSK